MLKLLGCWEICLSLAAFSPIPATLPNFTPLFKLLVSSGKSSSHTEKSKPSRQRPLLSPSSLPASACLSSSPPPSWMKEISLLLSKVKLSIWVYRPFPGREGPLKNLVPSITVSIISTFPSPLVPSPHIINVHESLPSLKEVPVIAP